MTAPMDELTAYYTPKGTQLAMTGDEWVSERDKKAQKRAEAARKATALSCAKKLLAASEELSKFLSACRDCRDGSGDEFRGISDGRQILIGDITEYAYYLNSKFGD